MPIRRRPREPVDALLGVSPDSGHDRPDGAPGDPHQLAHRGFRTRHRQPGHRVIEGEGVPGVMARPRHRHHRRPMARAIHPRRIGLQHHLHGAPIQAPPPAPTLTPVIPGRPATAAATPPRNPTSRPYPRHHQRVAVGVASSNSSNSMSSITVRWSTPSSPRHNLTLRTSLPAPLVPDLRQARNLKRQRRAPSQINNPPTEGSEEPKIGRLQFTSIRTGRKDIKRQVDIVARGKDVRLGGGATSGGSSTPTSSTPSMWRSPRRELGAGSRLGVAEELPTGFT